MKRLITFGVIALGIPFFVFAQTEGISELRAEIKVLQETKAELQDQIKEETLTQEQARMLWVEKMDVIRTKKEALFAEKLEQLEAKFVLRAEKYPEQAAEIAQRLKEITIKINAQRFEAKMINQELRAKIKRGEMTQNEAKLELSSMRESMKVQRTEIRKARKEIMESRKEARLAEREAQRAEKKEANTSLKNKDIQKVEKDDEKEKVGKEDEEMKVTIEEVEHEEDVQEDIDGDDEMIKDGARNGRR